MISLAENQGLSRLLSSVSEHLTTSAADCFGLRMGEWLEVKTACDKWLKQRGLFEAPLTPHERNLQLERRAEKAAKKFNQ